MRCALLTIAILGLVQISPAADVDLVAPGGKVEKVGEGFLFTEGPAVDAEGNVYFTDQPNDRILKYSTTGKLTTFMEKAGRSNGLYFDGAGNLWACADEQNQLWKIDTKTKKVTVVVKDYRGKLLNGPNDLWITREGSVYFTDPLYKRSYWKRGPQEQDQRGVYHVAPNGVLKRVAGEFKQPNGIVGTPDGKVLYVADIGAGKTYAFDVEKDGSLLNKRLFCSSGSDGMTLDADGNVYLTAGKVIVFDPSGKKIAELMVPESPANVCFGGKDGKTLFITARKGLYTLPMRVSGAR